MHLYYDGSTSIFTKKKYFEANSSTLCTKVLRQLKYISVKNGLGINLDIIFQPISTFILHIFVILMATEYLLEMFHFDEKNVITIIYQIRSIPLPYQASKHEYEIGHAKK